MTDQPEPDDDAPKAVPTIDASVPHSARIWNYLLGGKDNYQADRDAGDRVAAVFPGMVQLTRHSRAFIGRVVRHLAEEEGIRQFLDIGTGLPTFDNTHEVAQRIAPESRIVYVDNDPLVLVHAHALLTSTPEGACDYVHADVRDPELILEEAARTLDFDKPVGLMLMGILGLVPDFDQARSVTARLLDALAPGSFLGLNDGSTTDPAYVEAISRHNRGNGVTPYTPRTPEQITRFFDGLDLLEPGVVTCSRWRPGVLPFGLPDPVACHGGLARKALPTAPA
ncbi:SAM-dependent methyltransferase [Streptomyces radicis]|uniref:SAM-dependent methyltransferase n=1 Tax=Streptomyces radicis TaxID=1750517 RepID=A0A3A9WB31_9ACTN|nr:SAM-dependent methyltransferase [Streptomyces radicis]RKN03147.1 SAM-dependent methyltransferase [Streptomyces radicis]RKN13064.1 SAM-dependent methyltransferase [Streptomyces radicis]